MSIDPSSIALHKEASLMRRDRAFPVFTGFVFLCLGTPNAGADDGSRYAAIWDKSAGPTFVARHELSAQAYQQEFDKWTGQGYCLTLVSGYSVGNEARYAAIFEQKNCPTFIARHGLTSQAYQQEFDKWTNQGYCLSLVSGYSVGNQDRYAAIFEQHNCPAFIARHGLTSQVYQNEFNSLVNQQGYRLKLVNGYRVAGQDYYAAIWEKFAGPAFVARHGMSADGYQQEFNTWLSQGYRLKLVSGY
jgi:hypothetical protein